ncbi:DUF6973 domain-containing protein [Nocardia lijiangensis]|uniref:DUF6973 domain-containing protein n=1 Tax=Nocardia lijiangensis TaxID=299618 RepID=UPI003D716AC7
MSSIPPTKSQIRKWTFEPLTNQAGEWANGVQAIATEHGAISRQLADSPGFWRGRTGDAMRVKGEEATSSLPKIADAFEKGSHASSQIAHILGFAKQTAVDAIKTAEDERYTVGEDGTVGYSEEFLYWLMEERDISYFLARATLDLGAKQHEDKIKKALRDAGDAAESAREAIDKLFEAVPIPPNEELGWITVFSQVEPDPQGMSKWPDGALKAAMEAKTLGEFEPLDVTQSELAMLENLSLGDKIRFYQIQSEASETAEELFPENHANGDPNTQDNHTDAFRHAYWNALMTQEFGADWTKEYTSKHEGRPDNAAVREAMDLHNNEVGRQLALANPDASPEEMREIVKNAIENGDTVVINQNQQLSFSNDVPVGQTVDSFQYDRDVQNKPGSFLPGNPIVDNAPVPK